MRLRLAAHLLTAFTGPFQEMAEAGAFAPCQAEKGAGAGGRSLGAEEGFHAPADVRASPGAQAIAFRCHPVIAQGA